MEHFQNESRFSSWAGLVPDVRGKVILQSQGKEFFTWHSKDFFT